MILKIKFEVESDIVLDDYWAISHDGLRYEFVVGDGGRLEYLVVSVRTNAYPEIYHENGIATIHIPAIVDMCKRRVKDLDISVSAISNVGFAYIKSDEYSIEFVPEDDSEVKKIKIFSFSSSYADQQHGLPVSFDVLARTVFLSSDCAGLDIPLYLYKNSKKHFIAREFRISFYEAYFMIEYLYGNGKTNNRQVCKEFFGSHDLVDAIVKTREDFLFTVREGNLHDLLKEINILGVIEHIVKKRGELFHQSKKRNETWSPVLSENLINEAIFMQILCSYVSLKISGLYCDRYKEMYVKSNEKKQGV